MVVAARLAARLVGDTQAILHVYRSDLYRLDGDKNGIACERNPAPHDQEPVPLWESRSMRKQRREVMSLAVAVKPEGFQRGIMWGTLAD